MGRVLLLEDDDDLREVMRDLLRFGCRASCVECGSYDELVTHPDEALACDLALLDVNLGPDSPSGIDAYRWLRDHAFHGRIRFLTGHARTHPLVEEACRIADAVVLEKPIDANVLRQLAAGG